MACPFVAYFANRRSAGRMQISAPRGNCSSPHSNPRLEREATTSRRTNALSGLSRICLDLRSGSCCLHFTKVFDIMEPTTTTTGSRAVASYWQYVFILAFVCHSCCRISSLLLLRGVSDILDMPKSQAALGFSKLGEKYGPLTFIRVPGSYILIINSYDAACELVDKRGTLYADRPRREMMGELVGMMNLTLS